MKLKQGESFLCPQQPFFNCKVLQKRDPFSRKKIGLLDSFTHVQVPGCSRFPGKTYFTNQRIWFDSEPKNLNIPFNKLMQVYFSKQSKFIRLERESGADLEIQFSEQETEQVVEFIANNIAVNAQCLVEIIPPSQLFSTFKMLFTAFLAVIGFAFVVFALKFLVDNFPG